MTKQEIIEMLDSTITANGQRAISGQSLNAALHALLDYNEPVDVKIEVDSELNKESVNPIANAAVFNAFDEVYKQFKDVIVIDLSLGGTNIRDAFTKYDLANRLNTPLSCLFKQNSTDKEYTLATLVVEGFDSSGENDGTDMYKMTFVLLGVFSKLSKNGEKYLPQYAWSADCFVGNNIVKAYMFMPESNMVQSLGDGTIYGIPNNEMVKKEQLRYDYLHLNKTYYVIDEGTLSQILIAARNTEGALCWFNIKDGAFDEVYSY